MSGKGLGVLSGSFILPVVAVTLTIFGFCITAAVQGELAPQHATYTSNYVCMHSYIIIQHTGMILGRGHGCYVSGALPKAALDIASI